ncbi:MAG TPA: PAS domain S-box protein [Nitrospira sp.]|nr:PAS domain S-box protein [Nitrospira sp.]
MSLSARVLIVEDEAIVAEDLALKVRSLGYHITGVFSAGEEGIRAAQECSPDLVLIDLQLAGELDGVQTAEKIRQACDTAIVFVTAHSDPATVKKANATAPYGYILKPFGYRDLAVQLDVALHKHRADRALKEQIAERERAERKLRRSEDLLLRAQRGAKAGVWEVDLRTGRLTWSQPYYDVFGLNPSIEPSVNAWLSRIHPDDRARIASEYQEAIKEQSDQDMEFRILRPDGAVRWIHRKGHVETDHAGKPIRVNGISFDVTERKEAEQAVAAVALFPAQNPSPVLRVNAVGILLYMNPASEMLLGELRLQAGQPVPQYLRDLVHQSLQIGRSQQVEHDIGSCHYLISITPIVKEHYANLYWTDITDRKRAEQALRSSEQRAMAFLDNSAIIAWLKDEEGRNVFLSENYVRRFGLRDWKDKTDFDLWPPDIAEGFRKNDLMVLASDQPLEVIEQARMADGTVSVWLNSKFWFSDASGRKFVGGVGVDITERKQVEEQLRESEERFNAIVNTAVDGIITINESGTIESVNPAVERIFQYAQKDLIGHNVKILMPEPDHSGHDRYLKRYRERGERKIIGIGREVMGRRKDGSLFPLELSISESVLPARRFFTGIVRDISQRKQAEEERAEYLRMIDSGFDAIIVRDAQGRITSWNRGAEEIYGWTRDEALGQVTQSLLHTRFPKPLPEILADVLRNNRWEGELIHTRKDGAMITVLSRWTLERDAQGQRASILEINSDITDRKRAEEALRDSEGRFRELVERSPFGTYIVDSCFRIAQMNEAGQRGAFRNVSPVIGRDFAEVMRILWPEPVAADIIAVFRQTLETGEPYYSPRFTNPRHDVEAVESYEWEVHRLTLPDGQYGVVCYYFDSTELRNAEQALRLRSNQVQVLYELASAVNRADELPSLYETAIDAIVFSLKAHRAAILTFDEQGVMRFQAWRGLSQSYRAAVEGHSPWKPGQIDYVPITMADVRASEIEPALRTTILQEGIGALAFVPLTYGGRLIGKFMVYYDQPHVMTHEDVETAQGIANTLAIGIERKRAQEALRESEERLRLANLATNDVVWDWNVTTNTVVCNQNMETLFGWSEAVKEPQTAAWWVERVHPEDRTRVVDHFFAVVDDPMIVSWADEYRFQHSDGSYSFVFDRAYMIRDAAGKAVRMLGSMSDITEKKEAQLRLGQWTEELERQVTSQTVELLKSQERLRRLANELNLAEQRERKRLAAELHDHLQQLLVLGKLKLGQGKRLAESPPHSVQVFEQTDQILSDALTYTRTLSAELSPPVLRDHGLGAGLKWLAEQMKRHDLAVTVTLPEDKDAHVAEDQALLLLQSVRELLINSSKHAGTHQASLLLEVHDQHLVIQVIDNGRGFDPATVNSTDAAIADGLSSKFGIFSIRERMIALGGWFHIQSAPQQGTTATLRLPLGTTALDKKPRLPASRANEQTLQHSKVDHLPIRVLLVDDHAMVRQGLKTLLENYTDIQVIGEASNGEEAALLADQLRPTIVLMDVNMPCMNGIEATAVIKERHPDTPVIGLSVNCDTGTQKAMKDAGALVITTKEAAVEQLYRTIQEAIHGRLSNNHSALDLFDWAATQPEPESTK